MVSSQKAITRGLWEVISLPFCLPKAGLLFEPRFLPVWWAALPLLAPEPHQILLCVWGPHTDSLGGWMNPSFRSSCLFIPGEITSPGGLGDAPQQQEKWKKSVSAIPYEPPRNVTGNSNRDQGLWGEKAMFYCASTDSADLCPKAGWAPKIKGSHLCTLASRLQRQ
jgi:hypothetical protein